MIYLGNTFSPMMLGDGVVATVVERPVDAVMASLPDSAVSVVGHPVTAAILAAVLGRDVEFNRVNVTLARGDTMYCVIPNFRADMAREFTREEVLSAGMRCFMVTCSRF